MRVVNGRTYRVDGRPILEIPPADWPANAVYIGRAGHGWSGYFGNPCGGRGRCPACGQTHKARTAPLDCYRKWLVTRCAIDPEFREAVALLWRQDVTLVCFCKPGPCHGDILASFAAELNGETFAESEVSAPISSPSPDDFSAALKAVVEDGYNSDQGGDNV